MTLWGRGSGGERQTDLFSYGSPAARPRCEPTLPGLAGAAARQQDVTVEPSIGDGGAGDENRTRVLSLGS